mgnify:FL=1
MKISAQDVLHVAKLSRLKVAEQDIEKFTTQFNDILSYAEVINQLDTSEVQPTAHAIELHNILREDIVKESFTNEQALANAPERENGCYLVPKVVDN